ncbi:FbpB family small basic protein [Fictibacillus sp. BK138]|nr:FbpB family small basic protein [Fictibacillus sp. BK138]RZT15490.1 Fur-regulated basic protein B [Fictibacillus sp. BK138]
MKIKYNFKELVDRNKEMILKDKEYLEQIEKKLEDKHLIENKK